MELHEYVKEVICIYEYLSNGQCLSFHLVPTLLICVERRLRYA